MFFREIQPQEMFAARAMTQFMEASDKFEIIAEIAEERYQELLLDIYGA